MTALPADPFAASGVAGFGERLRRGEITAVAATRACLDRIAAVDGRLGAFQHVDDGRATAAAQALDALLAAGTDLGPLMGVPVAIKDLFAVDGMPTTAGSLIDVGDVVGTPGSFVATLKRAGCVILGKTRTVEFALGTTGISRPRGTPWNPWDAAVHRIPGGSSSGSAVAVAAGLCGFAVGTDTGGSVRLPAHFCGVFGLKTTAGRWPTDGVFPLSHELDSIGLLTRSAADAAVVFSALSGGAPAVARSPRGLRLGKPTDYFYDGLEDAVRVAVEATLARLAAAGTEIVGIEVPEAREREAYFPLALPTELIAVLGRDRFLAERDRLDPVVAARAARGLDVAAAEYLRCVWRRRELATAAAARFEGLDGWITPTAARTAPPVADFTDPDEGLRLTLAITRATQPANLLDLCATSTPLPLAGPALPAGLQVLGPAGGEAGALAIARAIEELIGPPPAPDLRGFLA